MSRLEVAKKKLEIQRAETAIMDLEVREMELFAEVERVQKHAELNKQALVKLKEELKNMEQGG